MACSTVYAEISNVFLVGELDYLALVLGLDVSCRRPSSAKRNKDNRNTADSIEKNFVSHRNSLKPTETFSEPVVYFHEEPHIVRIERIAHPLQLNIR